jgi:hypothetical protein
MDQQDQQVQLRRDKIQELCKEFAALIIRNMISLESTVQSVFRIDWEDKAKNTFDQAKGVREKRINTTKNLS